MVRVPIRKSPHLLDEMSDPLRWKQLYWVVRHRLRDDVHPQCVAK